MQENNEQPNKVKDQYTLLKFFQPKERTSTSGSKRLRKKADIEKEKEINKKLSFQNYFDVEAELGSDDENHDDVVKKISDFDDERDDDEILNQDLQDLIAEGEGEGNENSNKDDHLLQEQFFREMLERDKEEIKQVIRGPERREFLNAKRGRSYDITCKSEEKNDESLQYRIQKIKSEQEGNENSPKKKFNFRLMLRNYKHLEKKLNECEDAEETEGLQEMLRTIQKNFRKKFLEFKDSYKIEMNNRIKEDDKILENVVNLNAQPNPQFNLPSAGLSIFVKGNSNSNSNSTYNTCTSIDLTSSNNSQLKSPIVSRIQFGTLYNHKNSFLHAMKTDKLFHMSENEQSQKTSSSPPRVHQIPAGFISTGKNEKICPIFSTHINLNSLRGTNSNLAAMFTKSTKRRHDVDKK